MQNTLEKALTSVLVQLDNRFEMIVVDESTDESRNILISLSRKYPMLKNVFLDPDKKRTISDARNISVATASGDYCLLHIDCDDIWEPYLDEFIKVFHKLEEIIPRDFLLAGQQVNMGKRSFLISNGPYRNGSTGEDRDMWMRLAKKDAYFPLDHIPFFTRMPLPKKTHKLKALVRNYYSVRDGFRTDVKVSEFTWSMIRNRGHHSTTTRVYSFILIPFALIAAKKLGAIDTSDYFDNIEDWNNYKKSVGGTYAEIAKSFEASDSLDFLTAAGKFIFSNKRYQATLQDLKNDC